MEKDNLINALVVRLADKSTLSAAELKREISEELSLYDVVKLNTTLPSTGDGSATRYLFEQFAKAKGSAGMSKNSLEQYGYAVKGLCSFAKKEISLMTSEDIEEYLISLRKSGRKSETIRNRYRLLHSFYTFTVEKKLLASNPMDGMQPVKQELHLKKPLTEKEIEKIRVVCETFGGIKTLRTTAMINFMLDSGVRVTEMCGIKLSDVNFDGRSAIVWGKGGKEREVYFTDRTFVRLQEYLMNRPDINMSGVNLIYNGDAPLFASYKQPYGALKKAAVERELHVIGEKSGVIRLHPHLLRATMATRLAEKGVSIDVIAALLGHANLHTINRYVLLSTDQIKDAIKRVA
jgi:site-specific recombinase XerD